MCAWSSPLVSVEADFARTAAVRIANTVARRAPLADAAFGRGMLVSRGEFWTEHFQKPVGKRRRFEDGGKQQQATARVSMLGGCKQCAAQLRIAAEALGAGDQPQIELVLIRMRVHTGFR